MLIHIKKGTRERTSGTGTELQDRTDLLKLTLELERALLNRSRKISESGRTAARGGTTARRRR